jgi:hypothetical protein
MVRSGLKEMSNGLVETSLVLKCGFSMSIGVVFLMHPAVANAGWRAWAH